MGLFRAVNSFSSDLFIPSDPISHIYRHFFAYFRCTNVHFVLLCTGFRLLHADLLFPRARACGFVQLLPINGGKMQAMLVLLLPAADEADEDTDDG